MISSPLASDDWIYIVSRPGLRQEGRPILEEGQLFYQKKKLPKQIEKEGFRLITDIGSFRYIERKENTSLSGWMEIKISDASITKSATEGKEQLLAKDIQAGFYCADFSQRRKNTPSFWIFVDVRDLKNNPFSGNKKCQNFWINPDALAYWADPNYCESDTDCMCISGSGVRFLRCGNYFWASQLFGGAYACPACRCVNQSCADKKHQSLKNRKKLIDASK